MAKDKRSASDRAKAAVRALNGRFAPGKPKGQPKGQEINTLPTGGTETVVGLEKPVNRAATRTTGVAADRSVTIYNKQAATPAPRSRQLDPMAVRVAARTFVNRLPNPEGETAEAREKRIDRVAKEWTDNETANGQSIQAALSMPIGDVDTPGTVRYYAAEQGRGANTPGAAPMLYK